MINVLKATNLTKSFGKIVAVENLSFEVNKGDVVGVLGPNGSGKTTTLSMVLGIKYPDSGWYQWFEGQTGADANKRIGSLLEVPYFFPYLNLEKNLQIVANIRGSGLTDIPQVLETVGLIERRKSPYYTLSLGMKQRLGIASALLGDPEVLILDEPTNGLDPEGIAEVRELIMKQSKLGKTIIMASHILDEVEKVCSAVVILKSGKLIAHGKVDQLLTDKVIASVSAEDMEALEKSLREFSGLSIVDVKTSNIFFSLEQGVTTSDLNKWLVEHDVVVSTLETHKKTLESQFLELVKGPLPED